MKKSFFIIILFYFSCSKNDINPGETTNHVRKDSVVEMTETGQLSSINSSHVMSPGNWRMEYRITYLPEEASYVQEGDTVVRFDPEQAISKMDEAQSKLELQQAKYSETLEKNRLNISQKKMALDQLKLQLQINQNELEQAKFESAVVQEEKTLELEKTRLRLNRAQEDIESQLILNANSQKLIELEINQVRVDIERAALMMNDMHLTAPKAGLVVYKKTGRGQSRTKVKIGDNVYPQSPILTIPDLNTMQVIVKLNEVDRPFITSGMQTDIRVEAYPDTLFKGEINAVSRIVNLDEDNENVKTYNVFIGINSEENFRLKPGLSAKVTIFTDTLASAFKIPSWCLYKTTSAYHVLTEEETEIEVEPLRFSDGYVYVQGALTEHMKLKSRLK